MATKFAIAALALLSLAACDNASSSASRPTGATPSMSSGVGFNSPQAATPMSPSSSQSKGEGGTGGQGTAGGGSAGAAGSGGGGGSAGSGGGGGGGAAR